MIAVSCGGQSWHAARRCLQGTGIPTREAPFSRKLPPSGCLLLSQGIESPFGLKLSACAELFAEAQAAIHRRTLHQTGCICDMPKNQKCPVFANSLPEPCTARPPLSAGKAEHMKVQTPFPRKACGAPPPSTSHHGCGQPPFPRCQCQRVKFTSFLESCTRGQRYLGRARQRSDAQGDCCVHLCMPQAAHSC